jgi:hypoxanthine phosphoribosyltransferase
MYKHKILITEEQIQQRIHGIAAEINEEFQDITLDLICILKGGVVFLCDLMRHLTVPVRIHFVRVSSYLDSTETSGTVSLHFSSVSEDLKDRSVLLVEDIVDTGITLDYLIKQLKEEQPAVLKTCVFLDKPSRRKLLLKPDWVGFEISDQFVIGYGLDYQELGRNLRYVAELDQSEYR